MKKLIFALTAIAAFLIAPNTTHADSTSPMTPEQWLASPNMTHADGTPDFAGTLKAAKQGKASAQYNLGRMYDDGEGVAKDYTKAVYWYTKAAEQGVANAQDNLGCKYDKGQGVAKDMVLAYAWFNLAAINSENAVKNRDIVEHNLDPAGINEGQRLASNWEIGQSIKREQ